MRELAHLLREGCWVRVTGKDGHLLYRRLAETPGGTRAQAQECLPGRKKEGSPHHPRLSPEVYHGYLVRVKRLSGDESSSCVALLGVLAMS